MAKLKAVLLKMEEQLDTESPAPAEVTTPVADLPTLEEASKKAMAHANLNPILKMAIEQAEARRVKDLYHGFK